MSSNSQKAKAEKFEGDNFKKVYDQHMETLMKLKKKINTYHKFMAELYLKVTYVFNSYSFIIVIYLYC